MCTFTTRIPTKPSTPCYEELTETSWKNTFSFLGLRPLGGGGSGSIFAIDDRKVIKLFPSDRQGLRDLDREEEILYLLGQNKREGSQFIVKLLDEWGTSLVLERHVGDLRQELKKLPDGARPPQALRWSIEVCKGLEYLHDCKVFHGDLGCQNILIDRNGQVKICDFAGSSFVDHTGKLQVSWVAYEKRSQHPAQVGKQPTLETEIFALGSVLFEIWTSRPPYSSQTDAVVRKKYLAKEFPLSMIDDTRIRDIIAKCWLCDYKDASQVCCELEKIMAET
ncbi:kinase-like domain-containing protein [Bisporella sp. PMI_857]|nr:kinase-like domain-containing protein [Bisporella sp. PMI_857]